jgi:hypothetical protein
MQTMSSSSTASNKFASRSPMLSQTTTLKIHHALMHLGDDKVQHLPKQSMSKALIQDNANHNQ